MKQTVLVYALLAATATALGAQEASQSNPYEGTSNPPPDSIITTVAQPAPKPPAGHPAYSLRATQPEPAVEPAQQSSSSDPALGSTAPVPADGTDDGIVEVAPETPSAQPSLNRRAAAYDPDGDIVHPAPLGPGELGEGTTIRVHLLQRLSTSFAQTGESFRTRVASDVIQNGQVLIPAGAEIDGTVVGVSTGHFGGHGSMRLRPDTVILPDGAHYRLYAQTTGAPGTNTRIGSEGVINPGSRLKKDSIEYGGAVGAGAVTGAILGGPGGALAGTIVGASVITVHLLVSHPQADLEPGTTLLFTLSEPLNLVSAAPSGN